MDDIPLQELETRIDRARRRRPARDLDLNWKPIPQAELNGPIIPARHMRIAWHSLPPEPWTRLRGQAA